MMNLSVKDAARLLSVSEKTIYRWINQEIIPSYRIHGFYRFNRAELIEWATSRRIGVNPVSFGEPVDERPLPTLSEALAAGGVYYRIEGASKDAVLVDAVDHLRLPDEVDRKVLRQALLARERLASTSIGNGIAIPHPRNPELLHISRPVVALCFLDQAIEFGSFDGEPVQVLFPLIAPNLRTHLHLLALLGFVLRDNSLRKLLHAQANREKIFSAVKRIEARLHSRKSV
jgi:PTS system nitrogen regulatory IIA component